MPQATTPPPSSTSVPGIAAFWHAARHPPAEPTTSYANKTILITGANIGLGFEAAQKFAALGASTLIFGVRSLEKGAAAKTKIEQSTKCQPSVIQLFQVDMSSFESIDKFVKDVSSKIEKIDIAVLNAGVSVSAYNLSPHGWEMALQINVLSTAYLAILLLPKLRATAAATGRPSHLEFVASLGHVFAAVESVSPTGSERILDKVNEKAGFRVFMRYQESKLLEMWVMRQIAVTTSAREVIVVACCPGICKSNLGRDFGLVLRTLDAVLKWPFTRSAEEGCRTIVSATALGEESHGGFWTNDELAT
jgi:NAD(P)-dependent dehydrogenase (short-subunit alcohol dehydrogenase family)